MPPMVSSINLAHNTFENSALAWFNASKSFLSVHHYIHIYGGAKVHAEVRKMMGIIDIDEG